MSFKTEQVTEMVETTHEVSLIVCDTCGRSERLSKEAFGYTMAPDDWGGYHHGPMSLIHICPDCCKVVDEALEASGRKSIRS